MLYILVVYKNMNKIIIRNFEIWLQFSHDSVKLETKCWQECGRTLSWSKQHPDKTFGCFVLFSKEKGFLREYLENMSTQ